MEAGAPPACQRLPETALCRCYADMVTCLHVYNPNIYVISRTQVPTDLGAIHNGALLVDDPQRVAPPFPSAVRSNGPATGEGAYVVEGGAAT